MNNEVDIETSLTRALSAVQRQCGLPIAFGGTVSGSGALFTISRSMGTRTAVLNGLKIHSGHGLGGKVLSLGKVAGVSDYFGSSYITHRYDPSVAAESMRSIVAAPVVLNDEVRAVLYGALRTSTQFGTVTFKAMHDCAKRMAFELAVAEAAEKRLRSLETTAVLTASREVPTAPELEDVRVAHAELRALAQSVSDPALRGRLDQIMRRLSGTRQETSDVTFSSRETDVLALVAVGCTNIEIGERLGLSRETVKGYLRNIMRKLDSHSRTEAVSRARSLGLLP